MLRDAGEFVANGIGRGADGLNGVRFPLAVLERLWKADAGGPRPSDNTGDVAIGAEAGLVKDWLA